MGWSFCKLAHQFSPKATDSLKMMYLVCLFVCLFLQGMGVNGSFTLIEIFEIEAGLVWMGCI